VCERESERERDRETERASTRETERESKRNRVRGGGRRGGEREKYKRERDLSCCTERAIKGVEALNNEFDLFVVNMYNLSVELIIFTRFP